MNSDLKNFFLSFYKTLPEKSSLMSIDLNIDGDTNKKLYITDDNHRVIRDDIKDPLCGYAFSGFFIDEEEKLFQYEKKIEKTFDNKTLYAIPSYNLDENKKVNKALFLDRDGVLIEDKGYIGDTERVIIKKEFIEVVKYAKSKDYLTIVVTNQAGVSYGYYENNDVETVHRFIYEEYKKQGAIIDDFYYCPYHTKGKIKKYTKETILRKPEAGMLLKASKKYNIDIMSSLMIGDRDTDIIKLPYLKTLLVETEVYEIKNRNLIAKSEEICSYL